MNYNLRKIEDNYLEPKDDGLDHFICSKCENEISEEEYENNNELCEDCFNQYSNCKICGYDINEKEHFKYEGLCEDCYNKHEE